MFIIVIPNSLIIFFSPFSIDLVGHLSVPVLAVNISFLSEMCEKFIPLALAHVT